MKKYILSLINWWAAFTPLLLLLLSHLSSYSQQNPAYFYYYKGEKFVLQPDTRTIALTVEGESQVQLLKSSLSASQGKLSSATEDLTRRKVVAIDRQAAERKTVRTYYAEISTAVYRNHGDYIKQIVNYRQMPHVIMASPCFVTKEGNKIGLSNSFYVQLKNKNDVDRLYEMAKKHHIEVLGHNEYMPLWFTLSCGKSTKLNALEAANLFYETGAFQNTEPAFLWHNIQNSSDAFFSNQWGLKNTGQNGGISGIDIKAEQAWTITTGSSNIKTAIFDHGFEMNHPDLQASTFGTGLDAATNTSPSQVRGPHGTACAGIVGAVQNNNLGISGVAPTSKLISISINLLLSDPPQSLANGFNWAWQNGADVISNSWGGYTPSSIIDNAITNALAFGRQGRGTVVVFAAGNENNTSIRYPGNSNSLILVVGALSPCGERKNPASCDGEGWGSCYGTQLDVMAPGVNITTTDRQGDVLPNDDPFNAGDYNPWAFGKPGNFTDLNYTRWFNGTSAACPHVAGVAALVLSANPNLTVQQVNDIIERSAQKVRTDLYSYTSTGGRPNGTWNNQMGYGLVNAYEAVRLALPCPASLTITTNVVAPNTDYKQASATITALNTISNGAKATYTAGSLVVLGPGFFAANGSSFEASIRGCIGTSQALAVSKPANEKITYTFRPDAAESIKATSEPTSLTTTLSVNPNPFTDNITIRYYLPAPRNNTSIEIYSAVGGKVASLLVKKQVSGGMHSVEWNANGLPNGTYLVVLTTDKEKQVKKIMKM